MTMQLRRTPTPTTPEPPAWRPAVYGDLKPGDIFARDGYDEGRAMKLKGPGHVWVTGWEAGKEFTGPSNINPTRTVVLFPNAVLEEGPAVTDVEV